MSIPSEVITALNHVRQFHPEVMQVFYGTDQRWMFCGEAFYTPGFTDRIDVSILEAAADAVISFPAAFSITPLNEAQQILVRHYENGEYSHIVCYEQAQQEVGNADLLFMHLLAELKNDGGEMDIVTAVDRLAKSQHQVWDIKDAIETEM